MNISTGLISDRGHGRAWRARRRKPLERGWLQFLIGLPITVAVLFAIVLLALPALLSDNRRSWDRFGDH